jgi:hypothetical protein
MVTFGSNWSGEILAGISSTAVGRRTPAKIQDLMKAREAR